MARLGEVLIVDSDARALEALAYGLAGEECRALRADTLTAAAEIMARSTPQAVVISVRDPIDETVDGIARLRRDERARAIPVLALGPDELRPRLDALGIDHLVLPAYFRDVLTACKLLVSAQPQGAAEREMQGALSDVGLFFLVRTLIALKRSAIVQVERANRRGEVRLTDGEVTWAQIGPLQGMAALTQLTLWDEAALELKLRPVPRRSQTFRKGDELLDELERFLRDFDHATKDLGSVQSLFVQDAEKTAEEIERLPPEIVPALRLFDGHRSLGEAIEESPFRVFDTLRIVSRLLDMGVIRRKAIEKPSTAAALQRAAKIDEWLSRSSDGTGILPAAAQATDPRTGTTPASEEERRNGPESRRKSERRERITGEQFPAIRDSEASARPPVDDVGGDANSGSGAAPVEVPQRTPERVVTPARGTIVPRRRPAPPAAAPRTAQVDDRPSGRLELAGVLQASRRDVPVVTTGPSMLVDLGPDIAALEPGVRAIPPPVDAPAGVGLTAAVTAPELASTAVKPRPGPVIPPTDASPTAPLRGGAEAAHLAPEADPMKVGLIQGSQARVSATMSGAAEAVGASIQLDPALMAELDAYEMAMTPPTPPPVMIASAAPPDAKAASEGGPGTAGAGPVSFVGGRDNGPLPTVAGVGVSPLPGSAQPGRGAGALPTPISFTAVSARAGRGASAVEADAAETPPEAAAQESAPEAATPALAVPDSAPTPPRSEVAPPAEAAPSPEGSLSAASTAGAPPAGRSEASPEAPSAPSDTAGPSHAPGERPKTVAEAHPARRHPSSEFDALEADFFARESEIYEGDADAEGAATRRRGR